MITASIVLYKTPENTYRGAVNSFAPAKNRELFLVDNSPTATELPEDIKSNPYVHYIFLNKNTGYGFAHNVAIKKAEELKSTYHVVLNPDLTFSPSVINTIYHYMEENSNIGQIMPKIVDTEGKMQYLCKCLPTPKDLFLRRFLPRRFTKKRNDIFELRFLDYENIIDAPFLSGCFMFFRMSDLQKIGGFDERFFMYAEDIDITRRIHQIARTVYYPFAIVEHECEGASYKNFKMLKIHTKSVIQYFNKWGWFFDEERKRVNLKTIERGKK